MSVIHEPVRTGEHLVSEANGHRSREQITLLAGRSYAAGTVLGQITHGAALALAKPGNAGNGTVDAITVGTGVKPGSYIVTFLEPAANAGAFQVEDPDGVNIGNGDVGSPFAAAGLGFTITDGAGDFAAGDQFKITVAAGSDKFTIWSPANTDGSEVASAVLYANVDATLADRRAVVHVRDCEVNSHILTYFAGATLADQALAKAQLAKAGIIVR